MAKESKKNLALVEPNTVEPEIEEANSEEQTPGVVFDRTSLSEEYQAKIADWEKQGWSIWNDNGWNAAKLFEGPDRPEFTIDNIDSLDVLFKEMQNTEEDKPTAIERSFDPEEFSDVSKPSDSDPYAPSINPFYKPKIFRNCLVELDYSEKLARSQMLGSTIKKLADVKREAKTAAAGFKKQVEDIERDIKTLSETAVTGAEHRDVECYENYLWAQGIVEIRREDTSEVVDTREISSKERQRHFNY